MSVKPNISNNEDFVNVQDGNTIECCPNEDEIPYAQIPNELSRNRDISPECGHIIINLLSNIPGWRINVAQLINRYKGYWGRDKVYKHFKEAIKAGYIKKVITRDGANKNRFGKITYFVSRTPKFKESITLTCFQDTDGKDPENTHFKKNDNKERLSKVLKKNDNVSVHNSSAPPPELETPPRKATPYRSSCASTSTVSPPSATEQKFNPATFDPKSYILPSGERLTPRCANALKRYRGEDRIKLCANLEYFEKTFHNGIANVEAYLQSCIKHNYAARELDKFRNMCYATMVIHDNKLTYLKVLKTVVKDLRKGGDSISLSIHSDRFVELFHDFLGIERGNHVA